MISFKEMCGDVLVSDIPINIQQNMQTSLINFNKFREVWGKPMTVTSGYRSLQHHMDIYRSKGIPDDKIPLKSKHLYGYAIDIADPMGELYKYAQAHPEVLEECDLYCELGTNTGATKWLHVQSVPFGSYKPGGTRWFIP